MCSEGMLGALRLATIPFGHHKQHFAVYTKHLFLLTTRNRETVCVYDLIHMLLVSYTFIVGSVCVCVFTHVISSQFKGTSAFIVVNVPDFRACQGFLIYAFHSGLQGLLSLTHACYLRTLEMRGGETFCGNERARESKWLRAVERDDRNTPVNALVIITTVEELDLLKGLLAGIITGQIRMHSQKQIERGRSWKTSQIKKSSRQGFGIFI